MSKAQVKLLQVTRDGKLKLRFLAPMLVADFVRNFKNESIVVNVVGEEMERVGFKIENRDTLKGEVQLRL